MNKTQKFFICKHCGNIIGMIQDVGVPIACCGENMEELVPNTVDAATEKHVPIINVEGNIVTVTVGEVPHPMTQEHLIQWVYIQTKNGGQRHIFNPGDEPVAKFALVEGDELVAAFEYCNLHGLWKADK